MPWCHVLCRLECDCGCVVEGLVILFEEIEIENIACYYMHISEIEFSSLLYLFNNLQWISLLLTI